LAKTNDQQGKYDKALKWYLKELTIHEKVSDKEHQSIATTCNNIAAVYDNQGEYDEALEWYNKALAICKKILNKDHQHTKSVKNNIERLGGKLPPPSL